MDKRISFELPTVPYALRAFIEKAVQDERAMMSFVESPGAALMAAGVPIDFECLTKSDCDRLKLVLGNLRNLVKEGKVARDFRFEDIFVLATPVAYQEQHSHSESYAYVNFDHSQEGQSSENKTTTEGGIKENFAKSGLGKPNMEEILAPLINPGDLATIATLMQANLKTKFGR